MVASEGPWTWLASPNLLVNFLSDLFDGDPALPGDALIDLTVELILDFDLIISFLFC